MICPHCNREFNAGKVMGSSTSEAKSEASRQNGRRGGRPPAQFRVVFFRDGKAVKARFLDSTLNVDLMMENYGANSYEIYPR